MQDFSEVKEKLEKNNQEHILQFFEKLNEFEKEELIEQIKELDFDQMSKLYKSTQEPNKINQNEISPIHAIDKDKLKFNEKEQYEKIGEEIIKNDKYAIITMAGGQGTRLGFNKPKGTYKLEIGKNGKYIFEILTETLKKSKEKYGVLPYWYIMTSNENNLDTIDFFKQHNFFGYDKSKVNFFTQGELPLLTQDGKMLIDDNTKKIKIASNGNGGIYKALKKFNILENMKKNNIEWVYVSGVDNIMVKPIDPVFIGLTISQNKKIASKSVLKQYPEEKVGAFCKRNGKPGIVEYIELTEKMRIECNENGDLKFGDANIISHLLSVDALEQIAEKELNYHVAVKNNLYKFESFIFDGFEALDDMLVMRVKREEEFAPIKNKDGVDSPKTATEIYERSLFRWKN